MKSSKAVGELTLNVNFSLYPHLFLSPPFQRGKFTFPFKTILGLSLGQPPNKSGEC